MEVSHLDVEVTSLPPLRLNFELPRDYPSSSSPKFSLTSKWMPNAILIKIAQKLDALWQQNAGMEIIFIWTSFLKDDLVDFLSLESPVDLTRLDVEEEEEDHRCVREIIHADMLLPAIKDYDESAREKVFNSTVFQCNVCFDDQFGSHSIQFLPCKHIFCKDCMKDYFTIQIRDGSVRCLTCPEDKCTSAALPAQVKSLVADDLYATYDRLLLQTTLDTMADIVYCPRKACSAPVMIEPGLTMALCPFCRFAFCFFCKMTYHGVAPCQLQSSKFKEIRDKYSMVDAACRNLLEKRYGKIMLRRILEEERSETFVKKNCKHCPGCRAIVSKVAGCNKMTCTKCQIYFCWICGTVLPKTSPYLHFNVPGEENCQGRLFEGVDQERDDVIDEDEEDDEDNGADDWNERGDWVDDEDFLFRNREIIFRDLHAGRNLNIEFGE